MTARGLRIGIDARELAGRPTGVGRYLAELLARWTRDPARQAHQLRLYLPDNPDAAVIPPWLGDGGARCDVRVVPGRGVWWEQISLVRHLRRDPVAVFFAPAYSAPVLTTTPVVVAIHDVSFWARPDWYPRRHGARRRWLARLTARRAVAILTLTEFSRAEIVRWLRVDPARIQVIPPAVDAHPALRPVVPASPPTRAPMVLYVGSIFNRRHVPTLIEAFAAIAPRLPAARLEIVGENRTHPAQDLRALAATHGLADRVRLRDYVDEATLAHLYASARAFVFLSEYEGFGLTPLEAMARGVPAIVLDTPAAREACGEAAIYVRRPDDAAAVSEALLGLLTDTAWHADRSAAGQRQAARYSWDRSARLTFDAIAAAAVR